MLESSLVIKQRGAVVIFHPRDEVGFGSQSVVGEDGEGRGDLLKSEFSSPQRDGEIGGEVMWNAESVSHVNYFFDANGIGQPNRWHVPGKGKGIPDRNNPTEHPVRQT